MTRTQGRSAKAQNNKIQNKNTHSKSKSTHQIMAKSWFKSWSKPWRVSASDVHNRTACERKQKQKHTSNHGQIMVQTMVKTMACERK
jgi:hypothetical protein